MITNIIKKRENNSKKVEKLNKMIKILKKVKI